MLNIFIIFILSINFLYYLIKFKFTQNFLILFTGVIIFYPICFVNNPVNMLNPLMRNHKTKEKEVLPDKEYHLTSNIF
jgi:hypothetical protein